LLDVLSKHNYNLETLFKAEKVYPKLKEEEVRLGKLIIFDTSQMKSFFKR